MAKNFNSRCISDNRSNRWNLIYFDFFARRRLRISTTTSLYDTGLLDEIKKQYEATHSVDLNIISAGTGIALQQAQAGDADIVLVHSPSQELTFLTNGYGVCRKIIAYNYFTIVGPSADPSRNHRRKRHRSPENHTGTTEEITQIKQLWVSRGDNSGTFSKEQSLWTSAGYNQTTISTESWYATTGSGMANTLNVANQKNAYTLSDIGTYLSLYKPGTISLKSIVNGGKSLLNVYSVMAVNPAQVSNVSFNDAIDFIKWLVSDTGQQVIEQLRHSQLLATASSTALFNPSRTTALSPMSLGYRATPSSTAQNAQRNTEMTTQNSTLRGKT